MDSASDKSKGSRLDLTDHNISIWIDTYDDIFSDFDPRPFEERNLSDDFLFELKKFSGEKEPAVSGLTLLIPKTVRNAEKETIIARRLNQYFKKCYQTEEQKKKDKQKKGVLLTAGGTCLMILASYISLKKSDEFFMHTILVLTEPAGWFMLWIGLETLFTSRARTQPELSFYSKLIKTKIKFVEY